MRPEVRIVPAGEEDRATVARLLQLYLYDFAALYGFPVGRDGLYEYDHLDRFWQHPYLIFADKELAGFALVIDGCPITDDARAHFMAEFFVLRPYRRRGVGRAAVDVLFARHPGLWHIGVLPDNAPAFSFWTVALGTPPLDEVLSYDGEDWRLFKVTG